jgi:hypothetical protein
MLINPGNTAKKAVIGWLRHVLHSGRRLSTATLATGDGAVTAR